MDLVDTLVAKRAELMDRLACLQAESEALRSAVLNIEGTIRLFAPDFQMSTNAKRRRPAIRIFGQAELSRLILRMLRESASGVETADLITAAMASKAMSLGDADARALVSRSVSRTLDKLRKRGSAQRVETDGGIFVWRLTPRS